MKFVVTQARVPRVISVGDEILNEYGKPVWSLNGACYLRLIGTKSLRYLLLLSIRKNSLARSDYLAIVIPVIDLNAGSPASLP